jgi:hypothetical protein
MEYVSKCLVSLALIFLLLSTVLYVTTGTANGQSETVRKFRVTFQNVAPHNSHDEEGCGHWDMMSSINGEPIELMRSSCVPGGGRWYLDESSTTFNGQPLRPLCGWGGSGCTVGPKFMDVTIPSDGFFVIQTNGRERDRTGDNDPSPYTELINKFGPELNKYLNTKYGKQLSETEKKVAVYKEITSRIQSELGGNDAQWAVIARDAGKIAETAILSYVAFGTAGIPLVGQLAIVGVAVVELVRFIAASNPDDGIGAISVTCSSENNFCLGEHDYPSQFNGNDGDSVGDYDLNIKVEDTGQNIPMPALFQNNLPIVELTAPYSGSFIQSHFGTKGNFELLVSDSDENGFAQFFRENDVDGLPWRGPFTIDNTAEGNPVGRVDAISLIQANNFGTPGLGDLNVIVRSGDNLKLFWQEDRGTHPWHTGETLPGSGYTGTPAFIQSRFGEKDNFEVLVPLSNGSGFAHLWRDNDSDDLHWNGPSIIQRTVEGDAIGRVDAISLIQANNFGTPGLGDLNVIVRSGDNLKLFWMSDNTKEWHTGETLPGSGYTGTPAFIQSRFGEKGNFEVLVPLSNGSGFAGFWRDNDSPDLHWNGPFRIDRTAEGNSVGIVDAISLIQANNFGTGGLGDLNVIVRTGDTLNLFWREDSGDRPWHGPYPLPGASVG